MKKTLGHYPDVVAQQVKAYIFNLIVSLTFLLISHFLTHYNQLFFYYAMNGFAMILLQLLSQSILYLLKKPIDHISHIAAFLNILSLLVFETITCHFLKVSFSPIYSLLLVVMIAYFLYTYRNLEIKKNNLPMLVTVLVAIGSGLSFIFLNYFLNNDFPYVLMILKSGFLFLPLFFIINIYKTLLERYIEKLDETNKLNNKIMNSMRFIIGGELFTYLIHDIKNILHSTSMEIQYAELSNSIHPQDSELFEKVKVSISQINNINRDFLQYVRMEGILDENIDIQAILIEAEKFSKSTLTSSKVITFTNNFDLTNTYPFYTIKYRMFSVFLNLIQNSVQSLYESNTAVRNIHLTISTSLDNYIVSIIDNGPGIAPENLDKIWSNFSSKKHGTGLGLTFVKSYIEELNGTIKVESTMGVKTEFQITIPKRRDEI